LRRSRCGKFFRRSANHTESFLTRVVNATQIFRDGIGALDRSASRQSKTLELAQPHIVRPNSQACTDNVVSEKGLALCKSPFAETTKHSGRTRSLLMRARPPDRH